MVDEIKRQLFLNSLLTGKVAEAIFLIKHLPGEDCRCAKNVDSQKNEQPKTKPTEYASGDNG